MNARPTRKHLDRLRAIVRRIDDEEARLQRICGDRRAGSHRSAMVLDARAIERAVAWIEAQTGEGGGNAPAA